MTREHMVVVGASLAGLRAVEAARSAGHREKITLIGAESHLPYDRPPLSKEFLAPGVCSEAPLHVDREQLAALGVNVRLGHRASALDTSERCLVVDGTSIAYDALIIATGSKPRSLPNASGIAGVHTLRTLDDARAIRAALDAGARTVVMGGGFIGCEVAAAARKRGLSVTLVEAKPVPLAHVIGEEIGLAIGRMHEENGVELRCGVTVTGVTGSDHVERVELSDGTTLDADLLVVGIGAVPETSWLESSELAIDNGLVCDETLNAGAPGVYAAGDVARWHSRRFDRTLRVEHWTNAAEQGALAARNALDPSSACTYDAIPYFWSDCYNWKMQFVGVADDVDEIHVVSGDLESSKFTALYRKGDAIVGAFTMNNPVHSAKCEGLIANEADWQEALQVTKARTRTR